MLVDKGKYSANLIQDCIFLATGMLPARSCRAGYLPEAFPIRINLPEPFPGCCLPNSDRKRKSHCTGQAVQSVIVGNIKVSCRNNVSNIALFLLPETAIELVVDFNPYHLDLPVGLNRKRWT
ncbi:MAG: hypothetical protein F4X24_08050 [Rhodobacteraceae bacterium]|nr:hypothetical protein [Paracoccaceae bacterium]